MSTIIIKLSLYFRYIYIMPLPVLIATYSKIHYMILFCLFPSLQAFWRTTMTLITSREIFWPDKNGLSKI